MNDISKLLPHIRLHFNLKHPSFEECYIYGYEAALAEANEQDNPFTDNTHEHAHWLDGWWAGFYAEPPLFKLEDCMEAENSIQAQNASNDKAYPLARSNILLSTMLKITGAIAATAIVGYQIIDLVA